MIAPTVEMFNNAKEILKTMNEDISVFLESSKTVLERVKSEQENGALVAIARGNQASLILNNTNIPLVEMRLSGQALVKIILGARELSGKGKPFIAFVGFMNMFTDTKAFEEILNVSVRNYLVQNPLDLPQMVQKAYDDGADVLVGGEIVMECGKQMGMKCYFLQSSGEDIVTAIRAAKRVLFGIEEEKKNTAEVMTLLDYSLDGVLRLDTEGIITVANVVAEGILHQRVQEIVGCQLSKFFDEYDSKAIMEIIRSGNRNIGLTLRHKNVSLVANVASIRVENQISGGILSFQEFKVIEELEEGIRKTRANSRNSADFTFEQIKSSSESYCKMLELARQCAATELPVVLYGEYGTGKTRIAECIHNASLRRNNPFVMFNCEVLPPEVQRRIFVGNDTNGVLYQAHTGTICIYGIEQMDPFCQYQLITAMENGLIWTNDHTQAIQANIRVIICTDKPIHILKNEGKINRTLAQILGQVELKISPLSERREDISGILDESIRRCNAKFRKYIYLTSEARSLIYKLNWTENDRQLEMFIEKLVLLSKSRTVDADFVLTQLPNSMGNGLDNGNGKHEHFITACDDSEEVRILQLLDKHHGRRDMVAEELGISKTTLWRKMKKYGVGASFTGAARHKTEV